jgi:hypothetical protein
MGGLFTISNTSITLTSPKGGEIWHPGETHPITWTWVGQPVSPGVDVAITIGPMTSADVGSGTIVPTTPIGPNGSGSYLWTIPNRVPANSAYAIGVKSFGMDNMGFQSSSGPFAIGNFHRVSVTLSGSGYVSSSDSSISCGMNCSAIYADGASITLTATPSSGYTFIGWSGACSGSGACTLTLTADASVQANFAPPSLSISPTSSSATVRAGEAALYQMSVSGLGIGNGTVNMSCGALPEAASCTFQPNNFPMGQSPVPVNLSISTTAQQSGLLFRGTWRAPDVSPMLLLAVLLLAVCCALSHRLTGRGPARFLLPALLLALCLASACGGGGSTGVITQPPPAPPPFTPAGTYSVTITAQSGSAVQTMKLTLVVQ